MANELTNDARTALMADMATALTGTHVPPSFACPNCGESKLIRHRLYSKWHECKKCYCVYRASCSKHRHGGYL